MQVTANLSRQTENKQDLDASHKLDDSPPATILADTVPEMGLMPPKSALW